MLQKDGYITYIVNQYLERPSSKIFFINTGNIEGSEDLLGKDGILTSFDD